MKQLFIITILSFLVTTITYSQGSTINFRIENKEIKTDDEINNLKLPIKITFTKEFKDSSLVIGDSAGKITTQKFGSGLLTPAPNGTYSIKIDSERQIDIASGRNDRKIEGKTIKLQIGNNGIKLTINQKGKEIQFDSYTAGFTFYDALKIADTTESVALRLSILELYGINATTIKNNEYLEPIYTDLKNRPLNQGGGLGFLSPLSNVDVTNFASGLARFLDERAKEELNEAFFKKMKDQLNAYPELKTVFPQTATFLGVIETYSYSNIIPVLKEAFETDIQNLPENIYQIKDLDSSDCSSLKSCSCKEKENCKKNIPGCEGCKKCICETRLNKINSFFQTINGQWIGLGMYTVKEAIQSTNPADLFNSIAESPELIKLKQSSKDSSNLNSYNVTSSIELGNFLSQSLLSKVEEQVWITSNELTSLFKTKDAFRIYVGLLLAKQDQSEKQINFYISSKTDSITFGEILRKSYAYQEKIKTLIKNIHAGFNTANTAVKKITEASSKSIEAEPQALYDYYKTFTATLKQIISNPLIKELTNRDIGAEYAKIEQYLNPAVDLVYHVSTKKYSSAIYDAVLLLNNVKAPVFESSVAKSFIKYGTLISTVASAQSSDEVKKALESSVLPAGSSAIKRNSAWSISVNAYVGLYNGWAHSRTQDTMFNSSTNTLDTITRSVTNYTYGLYAPIGLSFNRGFKCGWGFTLSTQLLDVGALVNFYSQKGDGASLPTDFKVRLSDILSPGLQLGVNLPRCPITVIGGFQYVPALNKSSQIASSSTLSPIAWRVQFGIVVDIPLYNLKVWDFKN